MVMKGTSDVCFYKWSRIPCFYVHYIHYPNSSATDAASHGVHTDQIIFTDVAVKNEHIKRSALADLLLDT